MSAVEEYRMEVASRGLHPVTNDGSVLALADAAIAELEAENKAQRLDWMTRQNAIDLERKQDEAASIVLTRELKAWQQRAEQAEARVAQLEHVLSQTRDQRLGELEAELAALKARRCETCEYWGTNGPWDFCADMRPDFACNRWAAREETK